MHFFYDSQNRPSIVEHNGANYAYIHNLQGDIVGILNFTGSEVVKYTYDSWGKLLSTTGTQAAALGCINPFRYRGYVYDEETGLHYLRSRYYACNWCRFINIDVLAIGNMYQYCLNNPINKKDSDGFRSEKGNELPDYTKEIDRVLSAVVGEFVNHKVGNHEIPTIASILVHCDDYLWFFGQVTHKAAWDLKHDESWKKMFPTLEMPASDEAFLYRGQSVTREELGNITYGYLGTAMGCAPEILFIGGGIAKRIGDFSNASYGELFDAYIIASSDYDSFGDDKDDHSKIVLGIQYYWDDYQ